MLKWDAVEGLFPDGMVSDMLDALERYLRGFFDLIVIDECSMVDLTRPLADTDDESTDRLSEGVQR